MSIQDIDMLGFVNATRATEQLTGLNLFKASAQDLYLITQFVTIAGCTDTQFEVITQFRKDYQECINE